MADIAALIGDRSYIDAVNDLYEPEASNDQSIPRYHWWPKKDTSEWVQVEFEKPGALQDG